MYPPLVGAFCALACSLSPAGMPAHTVFRVDANCAVCRVYVAGAPTGIYVDDGVSGQCQIIQQAAEDGYWPVIAGLWGSEPYCPYANWNAVEFYPFKGGQLAIRKIPRAAAYVLPWLFSWDSFLPTAHQRGALVRRIERQDHPQLILWFYVNDGYDVSGVGKYVKPPPPVLVPQAN